MTKYFERLYTEWNWLKPCEREWLEDEQRYDMPEAKRPGRRVGMTKKEQRAAVSLEMTAACTMHALCTEDLEGTRKSFGLTEDLHKAMLKELSDLHSMEEGETMEEGKSDPRPETWRMGGEEWKKTRINYIARLAEWTQMHDHHEPFPRGPPRICQACAKVDNANTDHEKIYCGKCFPREIIPAHSGDVTEDPHRKDLYRLWLARNCNYINNYVPLLMLLVQNNMDCQACTSKAGVIEYMTKYMTKTGAGSLMDIMETSFARCMEKAEAEGKGSKSAIAKFFNAVAASDVKCQGETFHIMFDMPRVLCSREFTRLSLQPLLKRLKEPDEVEGESVLAASVLDKYRQRGKYASLSNDQWVAFLPKTDVRVWQYVNSKLREEVLDAGMFGKNDEESKTRKEEAWQRYLKLMSLYDFVRLFYEPRGGGGEGGQDRGKSRTELKVKTRAAIVVMSQKPLLHRHYEGDEYKESCIRCMLAFMNWGPGCNIQSPEADLSIRGVRCECGCDNRKKSEFIRWKERIMILLFGTAVEQRSREGTSGEAVDRRHTQSYDAVDGWVTGAEESSRDERTSEADEKTMENGPDQEGDEREEQEIREASKGRSGGYAAKRT